jgi:conjugative relaxase-like TrwC/TraI family protein
MISVQPLSGAAAADYYLDRDAGCEADYYLDRAEGAGRWVGRGATALGLEGPLGADGGDKAFRDLLAGRHPTTVEVIARPVWRAHPAGRLPGKPLVEAVHQLARERGTSAAFVLGDDRATAAFAALESAVRRRPGMTSLDPRVASRIAEAAGLAPVEVFRTADSKDAFSAALDRAGDRYDDRNVGYDVCVSAPKSVSTLFGLAEPELARSIQTAHEVAVASALAYLDREVAHGLRGHQGDGQRAARIGTDGFVAAEFAHRTSRENDPQLHTHVVVANLLHGEDGKWTAVDSRALHRHATTASYVYQASLRSELTRALGVAWTTVDKGIAEIRGVPTDLMREFSTRRTAIENHLSVVGRDDTSASQRACLSTRPAKRHEPSQGLREQWAARARRLGHTPAEIVEAVRVDHKPALVDLPALTAQLLGPTGLTKHKTTIDRRDVIQALCDGLPPGSHVTLDQLDHLTGLVLRNRAMVPTTRVDPIGGRQFSTEELVATERHGLAVASRLRGSSTGYYSALLGPTDRLNDDQRKVAMQLVYGGQQLTVVVGPAGSGKTSALATAYRAWSHADIPVIGTAVAALAARGLQSATGIPSTTLTRLLADLDEIDPRTRRAAGLRYGSVVVVDEASMIDTRTLARLLDHVAASGARLVLVGDTEQLPEIDAGGLFGALAQHPDTQRLSTNVRQHQAWEQQALEALRHNRPAEALLAYVDHGRVHVDTPTNLLSNLAVSYADTAAATGPLRVVALAATRREVAALNETIRAACYGEGWLSSEAILVNVGGDERDFRIGDVVVVTRNHRQHGVLNGMRGQVTGLDSAAGAISINTSDGEEHHLPRVLLETGDVQHGFALTVHRAQGITVDTALVFGTAALTKEAGYVALSRGRVANHLFTSPAELKGVARAQPFDDAASRLRRAVDGMAAQLAASRRQQLATRYLSPEPAPHPYDRYPAYAYPDRPTKGIER